MNALQLELTHLIEKKELTFGCLVRLPKYAAHPDNIHTILEVHKCPPEADKKFVIHYLNSYRFVDEVDDEIIGHPATLSDFHRWMNENELKFQWKQDHGAIIISIKDKTKSPQWSEIMITYDSSKDLLDQEPETLSQIIELIRNQ